MALTFVYINSIIVSSGTSASLDFTSIPNTFDDLCIVSSTRTVKTGVNDIISLGFNGSTPGLGLRLEGVMVNGSQFVGSDATVMGGYTTSSGATGSVFSNNVLYIPNYTNSANKSWSLSGGLMNNSSSLVTAHGFATGIWSNSAVINRVTLAPYTSGSFVQYSTAYLYGIKKN